jgi:hypothetical protein
MRKICKPLYDNITLSSSAVSADLFQIPIGQGSKTKYNTNMSNAGMLPAGESFEVYGIRIAFAADCAVADVVAVSKGYLEFYLGAEIVFEAPIFDLNSGAGLTVSNNQALATGGTTYAALGVPDPRAGKVINPCIKLEALSNFKISLIWAAAPNAKTFWVIMDGYWYKI